MDKVEDFERTLLSGVRKLAVSFLPWFSLTSSLVGGEVLAYWCGLSSDMMSWCRVGGLFVGFIVGVFAAIGIKFVVSGRVEPFRSWHRRWAWKKLHRLALSGNARAATALAVIVSKYPNEVKRWRENILGTLRSLQWPTCIEAVCSVWAQTRHHDLLSILPELRWEASASAKVKVLCALKVGRLEIVAESGVEVVDTIVLACEDADPDIAHQARECLVKLQNPDAIDAVCTRWAEKREPLLAQAIVQASYVARQPTAVRVLSALKLGRLDIVTEGGAEVVGLLVQACEDADPDIASVRGWHYGK